MGSPPGIAAALYRRVISPKRFLLTFVLTVLSLGLARAEDMPGAVLNEMNLARTQPQKYASLLAVNMAGPRVNSRDVDEAVHFLQKARPLAPLELSRGMSEGAKLHVMDMGPRGGRGHNGTDGSTPWNRMGRFGQWVGCAGENIYYGSRDARGIVCALIVDSGVSGRKHRKNIFNRSFSVAGVAHGGHASFGAMCVMDFAGGFVEKGASYAGL